MSDLSRSSDFEDFESGAFKEHLESYSSFERLVLFAALHVALTLSCAALAFIAHIPLLALLIWLGGTVVLLAGFALTARRY
jgi:hypothetical protein